MYERRRSARAAKRNCGRTRVGESDADVHAYADADRNAHADANSHAHADADAYAYARADANRNAYADADTYTHARANRHAYAHANANRHSHAHANLHPYADPNRYANSHAHANRYPYAHADIHAHKYAYANRATHTPTPTPTPNAVELKLAEYHPQLREAVLADVPDTAGDSAFLADGKLDADEIAALDRAQSVFGMDKFYRAWELDALTPNEVHAVLHMLTFYDPYTTVHDVTADPDDPDAEGAQITKALDDFGVYPGVCLYCKMQRFAQRRDHIPAEDDIGLFRRAILQHLAHHAKVQADALSPCDLRDFTEEELVALGVMEQRGAYEERGANDPDGVYRSSYVILPHNFTASVRLSDELLDAGIDVPRNHLGAVERTGAVLIRPGEVLSPFTHAMRAAGGPPSERGLEPCLEAVKGIMDWERKRYVHYSGHWLPLDLEPFFRDIFPAWNEDFGQAPQDLPTWAWLLVDESGGSDKSIRLMNQFRALNLPAVRESKGIYYDERAARVSVRIHGHRGVLLSPYRLHLHRNVGFAESEHNMDIGDLIRDESFPERCRIERRRSEGTFEELWRANRSRYEFWVRGIASEAWKRKSFHNFESYYRGRGMIYITAAEPILVYVCD